MRGSSVLEPACAGDRRCASATLRRPTPRCSRRAIRTASVPGVRPGCCPRRDSRPSTRSTWAMRPSRLRGSAARAPRASFRATARGFGAGALRRDRWIAPAALLDRARRRARRARRRDRARAAGATPRRPAFPLRRGRPHPARLRGGGRRQAARRCVRAGGWRAQGLPPRDSAAAPRDRDPRRAVGARAAAPGPSRGSRAPSRLVARRDRAARRALAQGRTAAAERAAGGRRRARGSRTISRSAGGTP